jgi:ABC-2 type transport system ATP-binding protein
MDDLEQTTPAGTAGPHPMIQFEGVEKRFGGRHRTAPTIALRAVTLSIEAGTSWGVVGPNGAGKSTLLALLLGFLKTTSGTIHIGGLEPRDYTRKRGAAYLPERFRLPPGWTVRDALQALAALDRVPDPRARATEAIVRLGLEEHAEKTIGTLSRGLLQRVGLAQALLAQRELVVLDEPTEGLDPIWRLRFRELVAKLRHERRTILMASHDLTEVEKLVDHVLLLDAGAIRDTFPITPARGGPRRYRIALQAPLPQLREAFAHVDGDEQLFTVTVRDTHELTARLSALLALGAVVEAVQPADSLEDRVRDALRSESRP